jgi:O-antigen/teichoic acid export membrane protein
MPFGGRPDRVPSLFMGGTSTQSLKAGRAGLVGRLTDPTNTSALLAALERVINRGAGAIVGVVMVFFVSPKEMGVYASAFLVFTFARAVGDSAIRQSAPPFWFVRRGRDILFWVSSLGAGISFIAVAGFAGVARVTDFASPRDSMVVLSLSLAGVFSCAALPRVTYAEAQGRWSFLARQQLVASVSSIVVGAALVPVIGIGGGVAQTVVSEAVYFLRLPRPGPELAGGPEVSRGTAFHQLSHVSVTNVLGWVQGQAERIAIAVFAGPVLLGYYSVAFQLARSLSDPASTGLMSWLRNSLSKPGAEQGSVYDSAIKRGAVIGTGLQVVALCCLVLPAGALMPESWHTSARIAVVMAASLPALMVQWSMSAMIIAQHRTKELFPWQMLGVVATLACGLLVATSLWLGVVALVMRDLLMTAIRGWLTRADLTSRARWVIVRACAGGIAVSGLAWAAQSWLGHV